MKLGKHIFLVTVVLFAVMRCNKNPITDSSDKLFFPLEVGMRWEYESQIIHYNFSTDSVGTSFPRDSLRRKHVIEIHENDYYAYDSQCTKLIKETVFSTRGDSVVLDSYHFNAPDGLYLRAFTSFPIMSALPKIYHNELRADKIFYSTIGSYGRYLMPGNGSLYFCDPPVLVIKYPLELGAIWESRWQFINESGFNTIKRQVIGREYINVLHGEYDCFVVKTEFDINDDNIWEDDVYTLDYYSTEGLIKREMVNKTFVYEGTVDHLVLIFYSKIKFELTAIYNS